MLIWSGYCPRGNSVRVSVCERGGVRPHLWVCMGTCVSERGLNYLILSQVKKFLQPYMAARRILLAQGLIMNVENTSPFSPHAPWKRQDLHHVGKEDSEKLGGVYLFTILWFNVHIPTICQ